MSNQYLKLRRSSVPGRVPTTSSLDFGEIALNTYDGLAFMKKSGSNGEEVVTIGSSGSGVDGGTTGYIPLWIDATHLTSSTIYQSGSNTIITGSLLGTSSWANNSRSSSFSTTASYWSGSIINAQSSSYSLTSSKSNDVTLLNNVTDISNFSIPSASIIYVKDTERGGTFFPYTGSDAVDNGMVFSDSLGNKWLRETAKDNSIINVKWYGARIATAGDIHDNYNEIISAINYLESHSNFNVLYFPHHHDGAYNYYYVGSTLYITSSFKILGDGQLGQPESKLRFAIDIPGIVIYPATTSSFSFDIKDIALQADTNIPNYNTSSHAITSRVVTRIENVSIDSWGGDGIHITADAVSGSYNYGNASDSYIDNVTITYCNNGIFIEGGDANTINFNNINVAQCRRWGVYDNGFLGNVYIKPHFAFCGSPAINGSNTVVLYSGSYYAALPGYDGYVGDSGANINKPPTSNLGTYWQQVTAMVYVTWSNSERYFSGGPLCIRNANAYSNIIHSYTEGFQPPIYLNPRSKVDGGDNGAGVVNGSHHYVYSGKDYITANLVLPNNSTTQHRLTIGEGNTNYNTVLNITNEPDKSGIIYNTRFYNASRSGVYTHYQNQYYNGYIVYNIASFLIQPDGASYELSSVGILPTSDNVNDLGANNNRWKNIYGVNFVGTSSLSTTASYAQTASYWSGSITNTLSASFASTASWVRNAQTASYVPSLQEVTNTGNTTTNNILIGNDFTSGSSFSLDIKDNGSQLLKVESLDDEAYIRIKGSGISGINIQDTLISNTAFIGWDASIFYINANTSSIKYIGNLHEFNGPITGSVARITNITGSLLGTASTASYWSGSVTNVLSASFASTASYAERALSASYFSGSISNAITSSYAFTASYLEGFVTSASFAATASYFSGSITNAISASYALTASWVKNAQTASYWSGSITNSETASRVNNPTGDAILESTYWSNAGIRVGDGQTDYNSGTHFFTGNIVAGSVTGSSFTGSFTGSLKGVATTASYWSGSITNVLSASFASTASYWSGSITNATSASQSETASYVIGNLKQKSGIVLSSSFGGTPLTSSVISFAFPFNNNNYSISITSEALRTFTIQNKDSGSFVVNSNSSVSFTGNTFWIAISNGES